MAMLQGGAKIIQFRDKKLSDEKFEKTALELRELTRQFLGVIFLVNDKYEIAAKVGADGVHLGWDDAIVAGGIEKVRQVFDKPNFLWKNNRSLRFCQDKKIIIGISTHSVEQALVAEKMGADYIGIGPVWQTPTKPDYEPIGLEVVREVGRLVKIPVVAIGGIDANNFKKVLDCGMKAVAMVRGVCDPSGRGVGEFIEVETIVRRILQHKI